MANYQLYNQLVEAYSDENLNRITGILIDMHKHDCHDQIQEIANRISSYISNDFSTGKKCYSRLLKLYHPDKGENYRNKIKHHFEIGDHNKLKEFSHVLLLNDLQIEKEVYLDDDLDYNPEYMWDYSENGFDYSTADYDLYPPEEQNLKFERNFFNILKLRIFGTLRKEFPLYYLDDYSDFEVSYEEMVSLEGISNCTYTVMLDISYNYISDLTEMWGLNMLEEFYASNNQINKLKPLSKLKNLRILDLSFNQIHDLTPLFNLPKLEILYLTGNHVPTEQIVYLKRKGVHVVTKL